MIDPELANDLANEMRVLEVELTKVVAELKIKSDQPELFEKFGQIIDRIYGTALTFGLKELASYCGTLKKICYECAKAKIPRANSLVLKLLETFLENVSELIKGITDPTAAVKLKDAMRIEELKAQKIHEQIFSFVKK
jgi:hypothetical protein